MSIHKRETVLARLEEILISLVDNDNFVSASRNRGGLDNDERPGLVLLDGDEENVLELKSTSGRPQMAPAIARMHPQIFILPKSKRPQNENVGTESNYLRELVVSAIATDADLLAILGPNGSVFYEGCETDLKTGDKIEGEMVLKFALTTVFDPYR